MRGRNGAECGCSAFNNASAALLLSFPWNHLDFNILQLVLRMCGPRALPLAWSSSVTLQHSANTWPTYFKGLAHQTKRKKKWGFCHHLLTLMSFKARMIFFLPWNVFLELDSHHYGKEHSGCSAIDLHLCSTEEIKSNWVNPPPPFAWQQAEIK